MSETHFNIHRAISELGSNNQALIYETAYEVISQKLFCLEYRTSLQSMQYCAFVMISCKKNV